MSRRLASVLALAALLALTGAAWWLAEGSASPGLLALVATAKAAVIGAVFLELDRSWPGWAVLAALVVAGIAGGAALLI